jgi:hypothetical protein
MIYQYLARFQATIDSRQEIQVERFDARQLSALDGRIAGCLRFYDDSILEFREVFRVHNRGIRKIVYAYHYQWADGRRVFRYDNAPHFPDLPGFPEHKHEGDQVIPAPAPDLSEVLREIDGYLYPSGRA